MLENGFELMYDSLVSLCLKGSFEMKCEHLASIHVYLVNSCLINSFKMKCRHLELILV